MLYHALVYPYFHYWIMVWGSTYRNNLENLEIMVSLYYKNVFWIINRKYFGVHTTPIFEQLKILKLKTFIYLILGSLYINTNRSVDQVHNNNTRNSKAFYVPTCKTNFRKFSVNYQGPILFNTLSSDIRNSSSILIFQAKLKSCISCIWL